MLTALADGSLAEKFGSTPPKVIALHGWARTGADFAPILDGIDALALHLPGFGITPEPASVWGSDEYANALVDAIAPFAPVVIVGHSFGGRVAVRLAARHPELVKGIVLTGSPLVRLQTASKPALAFRVVRRLAKLKLVSAKTLDRYRQKYGSADYLAAQGVMRSVLVKVVGEVYDTDLAAITAPTRFVYGELDTAAPPKAGRMAADLMRHARFTEVPGAGHLLEGPLVPAIRAELDALLAEVA
ncbi:MAG: alpha/beta fold hydrolase [Rhodoglobus sp.]